jgi:tetratricopeptide (TPR) repeat protein
MPDKDRLGVATPGERSIAGETIPGIAQSGDNAAATQYVFSANLPRPEDVDVRSGLNTLPRRPAKVFVGRDEALNELSEVLSDETNVVVTQALYGLGGVGKTELALHYADAYRDRYGLIGWITAGSPENIDAGLAALAARIHPEIGHATTTVATEWALSWLQTHSGWLLVLDNVEDARHVESLLGQLNNGHILITSRRDNWRRLATPIKLEVLTPEAAIDLILQETGEPDSETAGEIAAELGHLPLALEQAAAYICETRISPRRYLELLRDRPARMYATVSGAGDAQRTVARVWDIALSAIEARNPNAARLLNILAWYAPEGIPRALIAPDEDRAGVDEAISLLASYSMIDLTAETVNIHRLVQSILVSRQAALQGTERDEQEGRTLALCWLVSVVPEDPQSDIAGWSLWRNLIPHIDAIAQRAEQGLLGSLLSAASIFLLTQGAYLHALEYAERSLRIYEAARGPTDPDVAAALGNLASVYKELGHADRALPLQERALMIAEMTLGRDHPEIAPRLGNLALVYKELGRMREALSLETRALAIVESALGSDHPKVATASGNLATTYRKLGYLGAALFLWKRSLRISEMALGPDHPDIATALGGLALIYKDLGRMREALSLETRALAIVESALGPDHPKVATRLARLGLTYHSLGRNEEAQKTARRAYACARNGLGNAHPTTEWARTICRDLGIETDAD